MNKAHHLFYLHKLFSSTIKDVFLYSSSLLGYYLRVIIIPGMVKIDICVTIALIHSIAS